MIKRIVVSNKNTQQGIGNMFCRGQERSEVIVDLIRKSVRWKGILDYNQEVEVEIKEITEEQYIHDWLKEFTKEEESNLFNCFIENLNVGK